MYVWNFTNNIITDPIYYISLGYLNADKDLVFLNNYYKKQGKPIGDTQYCSFLSASFFVKTLTEVIKNKGNIYDPEVYDIFKLISITSLGGEHVFRSNNHITKIFFILTLFGETMDVEYQHIKVILPAPMNILSDTKILITDADSETINISGRLILL